MDEDERHQTPPVEERVRFRLAGLERCLLAIGVIALLLVGVSDVLGHFGRLPLK